MDVNYWIAHADSLFHQIFMIVMVGLLLLAYAFGTSYNMVNIVVYFYLIPASWIYLLSRRFGRWWNLLLLAPLLLIPFAGQRSAKADWLFDQSVDFLNWTASLFGSNYIDMSVYICVLVVGLVYLGIFLLTFSRKTLKRVLLILGVVTALYLVLIYPNFKKGLLFLLETFEVEY